MEPSIRLSPPNAAHHRPATASEAPPLTVRWMRWFGGKVSSPPSYGLPSIRTKAILAVFFDRLAHA
jgi:hypothetical protein